MSNRQKQRHVMRCENVGKQMQVACRCPLLRTNESDVECCGLMRNKKRTKKNKGKPSHTMPRTLQRTDDGANADMRAWLAHAGIMLARSMRFVAQIPQRRCGRYVPPHKTRTNARTAANKKNRTHRKKKETHRTRPQQTAFANANLVI